MDQVFREIRPNVEEYKKLLQRPKALGEENVARLKRLIDQINSISERIEN
jgi:hypothetical protein